MTLPGRPPSSGPGGDPDAERVLAQALRAMAGGGKQVRPENGPPASGREPLTRLQVLLIATIVGLLVGITAGLISLLV
ncbi:hypothetical protein SAMN04515671_1039 [Nakamurella panacisegetis]|uniref:Uncharacterized protein n=1 Tax=Nakamurella panacisegetis TaxID=1090615 RepID=A0A1H0JU69_9ACTN|nr:hypothetical protein [Nakamurella panacisegetis]SDO47042.1 hypothetical protein SAMN04515671_1039 [Nakamurella panacisegetis]